MIQIVPQMRILVAIEPVDFRNGIDGLVRICKQKLGSDPFCRFSCIKPEFLWTTTLSKEL
jgi:hypothetical protein